MQSPVILLVEDNPDDETLMLFGLRKKQIGNELVVARDGVEALDYLFGTGPYTGRDPRIQPQLVILDLDLPRINGIEVLRRIRADDRTRHTPVVILTSSAADQDRIASYDSGANSFVPKPVEHQAFVDAVGRLGLYWGLLNQRPPPMRE